MLPRPWLTTSLVLLLAACGPGKADDDGATTDITTDTIDSDSGDTDPSSPTAPPTTGDEETGNPAGPCSPAELEPGDCPTDYVCCSDDPATTQGRIPNYFQSGKIDDKYGAPIFSSNNNVLSYSGQCVEIGGFASPFANDCPVPCNPTWPADIQLEICGVTATCCQFTELDPDKDCVLDPDTNLWRAVTGADIPSLTTWGTLHTTNQDPQGASCMLFASGGGPFDMDAFMDCVAQLTVADQRGFCYDPTQCPCKEDPCAMKNPGWVPRCDP